MENRSNSRTLLYVLLVVVVALGSCGVGAFATYTLGRTGLPVIGAGTGTGTNTGSSATPPAGVEDDMKSFWDTYRAIETDYYFRPVDRQNLIYGAAKGMVDSLGDDYSAFLTPDENKRVRETMEGHFTGVGMYFEKRNNLPTVVSPIPGTPAERAGIRAKDLILAVNGRDITQMTTDQIASLIRGPEGTKVQLTLQRGAEQPFTVEITRAVIQTPAVTLEWLGDNTVAHIKVSIFGDKTTAELDKALQEVQEKNAAGIILDLRNNGGGYVVTSQELLGRFLPEGTIAYWESRNADGTDDEAKHVINNGPELFKIPLVVLVNGGSASASELVAGALRDHERAVLIGEQTFGKGSEQHIYNFEDGSSARITFAHWLTPKKQDINPQPTPTPGGSPTPLPTFTPTPVATMPPAAATATAGARPLIQPLTDRGLKPDIEVVLTENDYREYNDPQLDRAVEYIKTGK